MIDTYLFDLDGTLYDRDAAVDALIHNQYRAFQSELKGVSESTFVSRVVALDNHGYFSKQTLYETIAAQWKLSKSVQLDLLNHFWSEYDKHCVLPADTVSTLTTLKDAGKKLGIITNGQFDRQNKKIDALGIRDFFDPIVISEAVGIKKPAREIFLNALDQCRASIETSVFVGDHPVADIQGARNVGMQAVWKRVAYWEMNDPDVYVVNSVSELLDLPL